MIRPSSAVFSLACVASLFASVAQAAPAGDDAGPAAAETAFEVHSARALKTGQRLHVQAEGIREHTLTALEADGQRIVEQSAVAVVFAAEAEITGVDENGRPSEVHFRVSHCDIMDDGRTESVVPAGAMLVARCAGVRTTFTVDGILVGGARHDALALVASLHGTAPDETDPIMRLLGEAWTLDGAEAVARLAHCGVVIPAPETLSATASLVDVREHHGRPCMVLRVSIEGAGPAAPEGLPAGATITSSTLAAVHQEVLPLDTALPALADVASIDSEAMLTVSADGAAPVSMRLTGHRFVRIETTPVDMSALATGTSDHPDSGGE